MELSNKQIDEIIKANKPNYGRGIRRLRGILDLSQKEMAAKLNMLPQQLSVLERKEKWTVEQLTRVSETFDVPLSGLDYLANETDLLNFIFTNNTQGNNSIICSNNSRNTYHFGNSEKIDELFAHFETIMNEWSVIKKEFEENFKNTGQNNS